MSIPNVLEIGIFIWNLMILKPYLKKKNELNTILPEFFVLFCF